MNPQFIQRSHVPYPLPTPVGTPAGRAATATEARNAHPSAPRLTRVSNWLLRVAAILTLVFNMGMQDISGQSINFVGCTPQGDSKQSIVQTFYLEFDITEVKAKYPNIPENEWGIYAMFDEMYAAEFREGSDVLAKCTKGSFSFDNVKPGTSYELSFDSPIVLDNGKEYELYIPDYCFIACAANEFYGDGNANPISVTFYGSEGGDKHLLFQGAEPPTNSSIAQLTPIELFFNDAVDFNKDTLISLFEEGLVDPIAQTYLTAGDTPQSLTVDFGNLTLYNTHNYSVVVPENTIYANGEIEDSYKKITINYMGLGYKYFGYGRKYPANNKTVDYLCELQVALDCTESEYLGRDFKPKATLYKVVDDELSVVKEDINCVVDETAKGFYIQIYDFNLDPASTYQVVVDADTFHLWSYETQKPLYDTANEKLVLTYHTPEVITPLPRQGFGVATPAADSAVETLEAFKLTFDNYTFEGTFYYPVFAGYQTGYNVVKLMDETTGEEAGTFEVDIKWEGDQYFWLENIYPLDFTLLEGHTYEVVIPAGMFCCRYDVLHDLTLNEEYTVTYKGATSTTATVTCSYGDAFSIANVVARGEGATLRFTPSEEWAVDTVTVNGEEAALTDGELTLTDITEDMAVEVSYKFVGGISFNYTTGVDAVDADCPYFVALGESYVALSGLEIGSTVEVYNTVGMLLGTSEATDTDVKIDTVPGLAVVVVRKPGATPVAITVRIP